MPCLTSKHRSFCSMPWLQSRLDRHPARRTMPAPAEAAPDHPHQSLAGSAYRKEPRGIPARHPQRGCPTQRPTRSPQPPPGLTGPEEPASAVLAVESQPIPLATTRGKGGRAEQPAQSATTTGKGGRAEQWEDRSRRAQKLESRASDLACKGIDYISGESPAGLRPQPAEAPPFRPSPGLAPPPGSSPAPGSAVARETEAAYELSMYQLQSEDSPPPDPIPVLHRLLAGEKYSGPRFPNQDRCKQQ